MPGTDDRSSPSRVNILLVDDQPANLLALEAILEDVGANLVKAHSGEEALRRLLDDDYAVVLLDVRMPGMDGYETARHIRTRERCRHTPIIFITAYETSSAAIAQAYKEGAADHLEKPLSPDMVRSKVMAFVELSRRQERIRREAQERFEREQREHERKLAEERHRWELERLRDDSRRKDEFIAMMGHELRNPLAPIRNAVEILRRTGGLAPRAEQARDVIERQVKHMSRLIDDLLDVTRVSLGKITLHKQAVPLTPIVEQAIATCRPLMESRHHELAVSLPPTPLMLEADPDRLQQILSNLLINAAKYTEPHGHVWLTLEQGLDEVIFRVRDTGIGIPSNMQDRIFDPFTQLEARPRQSPQWGLGIGLTLVKTLVQLHGGRVSVASAGPGQGSEFIVNLPAKRPSAGSRDAARAAGMGKDKPRILVVDHDVDAAISLGMVLQVEGYQVQVVHDGPAALAQANVFQPQVLLLDIGSSHNLNGREVARLLRQEGNLQGALFIALTLPPDEDDVPPPRPAGFDHLLTKPLDLPALQRLLGELRK